MSGSNTVEVSKTEHEQLRTLAQLFDKVWNDPEAGENFRRAAKKHNPNITIPDEHPVAMRQRAELDETKTALTGLQTAFEEYKTAAETEKQTAKIREQLGAVQTKYGLTDEGMTKAIEIMQQRNLADPEAAALLYRESLPKAPPQGASSKIFDTRADMFGTTRQDERWEKLHTDEPGFFADVVNEVFSEMPPGQ